MKHIIALILGLLCLVGIYFFVQYSSQPTAFSPRPTPTPSITQHKIVQEKAQKLLFVPYWSLPTKALPTEYDQLIYFGVVPNASGINTSDDGYKNLPIFIKRAGGTKKLLAIRMLDQSFNATVLQNKTIQTAIMTSAIQLAKQNGFEGIVVDFEYNALAFDSVVNSISNFSASFAKATHQSHLTYYQAMYGDAFARLRPYDITAISKNADGVIVMAYDLHKANGDAGPNFPLSDKATQGYDLKMLVDDFAKKMPTQKLIIAFGLYGYDWRVDKNGHSSSPAASLGMLQMQQKFINKCTYDNCVVVRDTSSSETKVTYTDANKNNHIVWFEDLKSVAQKSEYLHTQGINAVAFWAYSYF